MRSLFDLTLASMGLPPLGITHHWHHRPTSQLLLWHQVTSDLASPISRLLIFIFWMRSLFDPILIPERFTTPCYTNGTFFRSPFWHWATSFHHMFCQNVLVMAPSAVKTSNKWICNSSLSRRVGNIINQAFGSSVFCYIQLYLLLSPNVVHIIAQCT